MATSEREKLRAVLKYRSDAAAHFETARSLGPQLFLGTIPAVINALIVVFAGNIIVEDPYFRTDKGLRACYDSGIIPHVYGVIAQAYGLLGLLAMFLLGKQIVVRVQVPVLLLIGLLAFSAGWVFVGVAAALAGRDTCAREAPILYNFSIAQSVLTPLLAAIWLLRYGFSTIIWCLKRARASCARLCWVCCKRGKGPQGGMQSKSGAAEGQGEEQGEGESFMAVPESQQRR